MADYTDTTAVSNFLQRALTAYETSELTDLNDAVKIWIDKKLNSRFDSVAATTRYYDGGTRFLDIDPCTAVTEVKAINDDASDSYAYTEGTEYILEPQNETVKREIRKRIYAFPRGTHRLAVTAKFSEYDGGVPADIKILATRLLAGLINSGKRAATGNVTAESLEGHSINYDTASTAANIFDALCANDPTVASIIATRQELYTDNYVPDRDSDDLDEGGLLA